MGASAAAAALAAALGATGHLDLDLHTEVRGLRGDSEAVRSFEPVPYEVAPTLAFRLESDRRLRLSLGFGPRLFLLAPDEGGYRVHDVAALVGGTAALAWRPDERLALGLTAAASRGTQVTSPLAQLGTSTPAAGEPAQPGQPGQPGPLPLEPGGGVRTGKASTISGGAGFDWRLTRSVVLGGAAGWSRTAGIGAGNRVLFPLREGPTADLHLEHAATAHDSLWLGASYTRSTGTAERLAILGLGGRWDRRVGTDSSTSLSAGAATTLEDTAVEAADSTPLDRVAPTLGLAIRKAPAEGVRGLGAGASLSYSPYADRFFNRVRQRLAAHADVVWLPLAATRVSAAVSVATALGGGETGPTVAAAELGVAWRQATSEVGLSMRGGYQEALAPTPSIWQWGVGLTARWGERFPL